MPAFMNRVFRRLIALFISSNPVPQKYQKVFFYLYMDMAWMGVLSGSTMAFIAVYATRQGALASQIGLLSAVPGLVNLLFALPAGIWLSRHSMGKSIFWASVFARIFYLFLVPLPVLLLPEAQVWVIILVTFIMTIPGTAVVVGFNSMFADLVPFEWRGHVMGIRNALISVTATVMTLVSGQILQHTPFPTGYQIVFGVGFLGAAFSSLHLYKLAKIAGSEKQEHPRIPEKTFDQSDSGRRIINELSHLYHRGIQSLRLDVMRGPFIKIMALLFTWHLAQFSTIPCITPFIVNQLKISDQMIGLANGLFNMMVFFGSLKFSQVAGRYGNKNVTGMGILLLSVYPILTAFGIVPYIIANIVGGIAWSLVGGGLYNYLLDNIPGNDRPPYMAWYNLVANAAILIGSLMGPAVGGVIGMTTALIIFGIFRFISGVAILRWG